MEGESKEEMYRQFPPGSFPHSLFIRREVPFEEVKQQVLRSGLDFPFVAKPNVGMMGFMFRKIGNMNMLEHYHKKMPFEYVIQEFVNYPIEVSVFYYRLPGEQKGTISGFLKKESPFVTGDGITTLEKLLEFHPELKHKADEFKERHKKNLDSVLPAGEIYILSHASNRSQGGKLVSLEQQIDDNLLKVFDEISHYSGQFYYGRYDVKCASVEDLKHGRNFCILEYNGSGSGTQHVYGNNKTLLQACKIILDHWKMLYKISAYNKRRGFDHWEFTKGFKFLINAKKNLKILKALDAEFPVSAEQLKIRLSGVEA